MVNGMFRSASVRVFLASSSALCVLCAHESVKHPWTSNSDPASPFKNEETYTGPFMQITATGLPVANPLDGFGPEDKLVACVRS